MKRRLFLLLSALWVADVVAAEEVSIVPQSEWAADGVPREEERLKPHSKAIHSIVIHHTETPNQPPAMEKSRLLGIRRYHMQERGWGDIAYHCLIGPSGRIYEGREWSRQGDSGTVYDLDGRLLVCLVGSFTETMPEDAAMKSLVAIVVAKLREHRLKPEDVTTHRMVAATDCPGDRLQKWFETEGREAIAKAFAEPGP